jgi:membrane protein implicated in regulation of membrane protease activity
MPRDERHPTPLLNMSPSGLPGLLVVIAMFLGIWTLLGGFFWIALAFASIVAAVSVLAIRAWRANHPRDKRLLLLDPEPKNGTGTDA